MHRETAPLHHSYCTRGYIISPLHQAVWWSCTLGALLISCRKQCFPLADTIWCLFQSKFRDAGSFKLRLCCRKQTLMWLPGSAGSVELGSAQMFALYAPEEVSVLCPCWCLRGGDDTSPASISLVRKGNVYDLWYYFTELVFHWVIFFFTSPCPVTTIIGFPE